MSLTVDHPPTTAPPRTAQVARQLGRVELRRLAIHPATLIGFVLACVALWALNTGSAPVLNRAGATTSLPLALVAAGGMIAAADAAVRMWKTERSEALDVTPASERARTLGLLMASLGPLALALGLQAVALIGMSLDRPVTVLDWWDVLAGPLVVLLGTVIGVAAGRWAPSRLTGPVALVVVAAITITLSSYGVLQRAGLGARWLAPIVPLEFDPYELSFRPTGAHALYLVGLIGVLVSVAALRGQMRHTWLPLAALLLSLGLTVLSAGAQFAAYEEFDYEATLARYVPPAAEYTCEVSGSVEYCAHPGYEEWIEEWEALVQPVLELAPQDVANRPLRVTQYPTQALDLLFDGSSGHDVDPLPGLATGMWWGRRPGGNEWGGAWPFGMALGTSAWAVGLPLELTKGQWITEYDENGDITSSEFVAGTEGVPEDQVASMVCTTLNQGRAMIALWMAAQASPVTEQHLRNKIEDPDQPIFEDWVNDEGETVTLYVGVAQSFDVGQPYPWYALDFANHEAYYAYQLLDLPNEEVATLILRNWDYLTDPTTDTREALQVFGLEPVPGYNNYFPDDYTFYPVCP